MILRPHIYLRFPSYRLHLLLYSLFALKRDEFAECFIPTPVCYLYTYYQRITLFTGLDGSYVADAGNPNNTLVLIAANCFPLVFLFWLS
jgi:hypothetical protein|nr:MAG TPA: hypothetical protein [Caudoviricetes sp.]